MNDRELFSNIGYELIIVNRQFTIYENNNLEIIIIDKKNKEINKFKFAYDNGVFKDVSKPINVNELKAINKLFEELGV